MAAAKPAPPATGGGEGESYGAKVAKVIFSPFILLFMAFKIYVLGCFGAYVNRFGRNVFCGLCVKYNHTFKDKDFPHDHRSIAKFQGKTGKEIDTLLTWRRIGEVMTSATQAAPGKAPEGEGEEVTCHLFHGPIEAADIAQGSVGDCWLMSALACLATKPGAIQRVFLTQEYNTYGRYKLRLYNGEKKKWQVVVVDDYIPCRVSDGKPAFAKPNGGEAWVVLIEKAMAKFLGGNYQCLDSDLMIKAMECLTGDFVCMFRLGDNKDAKFKELPRSQQRWTRLELTKNRGPAARSGKVAAAAIDDDAPLGDLQLVYAKDEPFDHDLMFKSIVYEIEKGSTIGASNVGGSDDTHSLEGIVQGHAYGVMMAREVEGFKFLQLRNPWGKFEWTGAWGDKSPLWDEYPKVKEALDFSLVDNGMFYMVYEDFVERYNVLEFCLRSTGFDDVRLELHEMHPVVGPCWGCLEGCFSYWCCCEGAKALFCGRKVTSFQRPQDGCMV